MAEHHHAQVTEEDAQRILQSFAPYAGKTLTDLQREVFAADRPVTSGRRKCIIGRTSSGKTLVPLLYYAAALLREGTQQKLLYLVPYRALARQKYAEICRLFPEKRTLVSTSEFSANDRSIALGNCDIAVIIYEKAYLFQTRSDRFFRYYDHVVFDEVGLVEDRERGLKADFLLQEACRLPERDLYLLASYYDWQPYAAAYGFDVIRSDDRPVKLTVKDYSYFVPAKRPAFRYPPLLAMKRKQPDQKRNHIIYQICDEHWDSGEKILIFLNSQGGAQDLSRQLYQHFVSSGRIPQATEQSAESCRQEYLQALGIPDVDTAGILYSIDYLAYHYGITFHHAALMEEMREMAERDFLAPGGRLRIGVATETLAFGLNSNVDVVIIADMTKREPGEKYPRFLTGYEYENYIGRAGRYGWHSKGLACVLLRNTGKQNQEKEMKRLRQRKTPPRICSRYDKIFTNLQAEAPFHLLPYFRAKTSVDARDVFHRLQSYPCWRTEPLQYSGLLRILEWMQQAQLIAYVAEDEDEIDEEAENELDGGLPGEDEAYPCRITERGRRLLGYVVRSETFDRLERWIGNFIGHHMVCIFDLIYMVSTCREMREFYGQRELPDEAPAFAALLGTLRGMIDTIHAEHQVSDYHYQLIGSTLDTLHLACAAGIPEYLPDNPDCRTRSYVQKLEAAILLYLWSSGRSVAYILERFDGVTYASLKHAGMKAEYLLDFIRRDAASRMTEEDASLMKHLGPSLYYGIALDLVEAYASTTIEPEAGRALRTLSIYRNLTDWKLGLPADGERERLAAIIETYRAESASQDADLARVIKELIP